MTGLLTAIDGEPAVAERRVEQLREIRALALSLDGAGEGAVHVPPSLPAGDDAPPRAADGDANGARAEAGSFTRRNGADAPAATAEVAAGSGPSARAPKAAPLMNQPTQAAPKAAPKAKPRAKRAAREGGDRRVGDSDMARSRVKNTLVRVGSATAPEIMAQSGLSATPCNAALSGLVEAGLVVVTGTRPRAGGVPGRGSRIYALKAQADAQVAALGTRGAGAEAALAQGREVQSRRRDVLACVAEGAGLDEPEIAAQLDMDREHVAEATGALLEAGDIVRRFDGTYVSKEDA